MGGGRGAAVKISYVEVSSCLIFGVNITQHWLNYKGEKQLLHLSRKQKIVVQLCFGTSQGPSSQ